MKAKDSPPEPLQKILELKRRESPPAPYFRELSDRVMERIHTDPPPQPATWHERLGLGEDWKPVMLWPVGLLACAILGVALVIARSLEKPAPTNVALPPDPVADILRNAPVRPIDAVPGFQPLDPSAVAPASMAPVINPGSSAGPAARPLKP